MRIYLTHTYETTGKCSCACFIVNLSKEQPASFVMLTLLAVYDFVSSIISSVGHKAEDIPEMSNPIICHYVQCAIRFKFTCSTKDTRTQLLIYFETKYKSAYVS